MKFWKNDIVVRTTNHPTPSFIYEGMESEKEMIGIITEVVIDMVEDEIRYYRLNNGILYDETEIRPATLEERMQFFNEMTKQIKHLVKGE